MTRPIKRRHLERYTVFKGEKWSVDRIKIENGAGPTIQRIKNNKWWAPHSNIRKYKLAGPAAMGIKTYKGESCTQEIKKCIKCPTPQSRA